MTRLTPIVAALISASVLSGCGADGRPVAPTTTAVAAGVTVGSGGVQPSAAIARTSGNVTVGIGLGN